MNMAYKNIQVNLFYWLCFKDESLRKKHIFWNSEMQNWMINHWIIFFPLKCNEPNEANKSQCEVCLSWSTPEPALPTPQSQEKS